MTTDTDEELEVKEPEVETEAIAPAEEEAAPPSYLEQVGLAGDEWKDYADKDPVEVGKALAERLTKSQQDFEQRLESSRQQWNQQFQNHPAYIQFQRYQQEQANKPPVEAKDPLADWFAPPTLDRDSLGHWTQRNAETGEMEFKGDTPHDIKLAYANHLAYTQRWWREFENDPRGKLVPLVEHLAGQIAERQFQQYRQQEEERNYFVELHRDYGKYLFEKNQFDQDVLTPIGRQLVDESHRLMGLGVGNRKEATAIAFRAMFGDLAMQERAEAARHEAAKQKHETEKSNSKKRNGRSGSLSNPENPRTPPQTDNFADLLRHQFDLEGKDDAYFQTLGN